MCNSIYSNSILKKDFHEKDYSEWVIHLKLKFAINITK